MTAPAPARFPAMEPEPPPPSVRARLQRLGAVVAVLAVVAAGALLLGRDRDAPVRPAAAAPASVVVLDGRSLARATETGRIGDVLGTDLDVDPVVVDLAVAPDGRRGVLTPGDALSPGGLLLDLTAAGPAVPAAPADLLARSAVVAQPWADGGRSLLLSRPGGALALVDAQGRPTSLGSGTGAAADPTGPGAAVVVPGAALPAVERLAPASTAVRVELRRAGAPPAVLVTAAAFAAAVGLPAGPVVVDRLVVSPDGSRVLVSGWSASARVHPAHGLLVVDRTGRQVAAVRSRTGTASNWAVWAPDGRSLALGTYRETPTEFAPDRLVELWDLAAPPRTVALPGELAGAAQEPCVWAPGGGRLLCGDGRGWFDVDAAAGTATRVDGVTGRPVAWLA